MSNTSNNKKVSAALACFYDVWNAVVRNHKSTWSFTYRHSSGQI